MSMPLCGTCWSELDDDILSPCPQCGGKQGRGDADCWFCVGMGQQIVTYCNCPGRTRADGWRAVAMMPDRRATQ